jgi:hypothetical protein
MLKEEQVDEDEGGRLMDVTQTCTAPFTVRLGPSCMKKTPEIADYTRIENKGRLCRIVNFKSSFESRQDIGAPARDYIDMLKYNPLRVCCNIW